MALERNTWSGLEKQAKAGYLKFDPADALAAAKACADLVDDLLGMAAAVTDLRLNNVAPIGTLTSGAQLAMAFTTKGSRLHTILNDHAKIVTDMGETYIAAGKAYTKADGESGDTFKALGELKMPTEATPYTPGKKAPGAPDAEFDKPSGGAIWKDKDGNLHVSKANAETFASSLKDYQGAKDPGVTANIENKDSLSFAELYELGRDLDPQPVLAAAGTWHSLANDLLGKLNGFVSVISAGTEAWEGQGASAAAEAVRGYSDGVQPLITSMIAMSQNLDYTAQWLYLTKLSMPATSDPGDCCPGKVTRRYRNEWQKHYGEGMKNTVSVMPVVNGPIPAPQPSGGQGQNQPGNNQNKPGANQNQPGSNKPGVNQNGPGSNTNGRDRDTNTGGQRPGDGEQGNGNQKPRADYPADYQDGQEAGQGRGGSETASSGPNSGAGVPGGDTELAGTSRESGGSVPLPRGLDAAALGSGSPSEGGPTRSGTGSGPAGLFGGSAGPQRSAAPARSSGGPRGSTSPQKSVSPSAEPMSSASGTMPDVPSLGSVPLPRMSSGTGGSPGGTPSRSSGTAPGAGAKSLEDALARATGADPAQVKSVLDNLPGLLNEDTLSRLTGLPPEQVRSILDSIPDVVDENALSKLSGVDPAGVRSVLENLPKALDEQALAAATRTGGPSAGLAPHNATAAGTGSAQSADSLASAGRDLLGQLGKALTQGVEALTQLGSTLPGAEKVQELLRQFDPNALAAAAGDAPADHAGAGDAGSSGVGTGVEAGLAQYPTEQSRAAQLFPRASLPGAETPVYAAAAAGARQNGVHSGAPMMGAPMMGAPAAGGAAGQDNTSHKPAKFLQSKVHLDEAIGAVPNRVKPVVES
ncbi:PPE domain-containing protein [Nocardia amamiensis]|uniref:PPE domain-containing protein n=1 Tax=Nocardia amamiensis TaxID=404578 RepID=UPI00082EE49E|nr:PPE domain-containing protein [Nocardia amamiensis]